MVNVRLRSRDIDACHNGVARQYFRGSVTLAPARDSWVVIKFSIRKTHGPTPHRFKSECPKQPDGDHTPPEPQNCQGYVPCLPPGPDVDCKAVGATAPRYVDGPVSVTGDDPYDLDRDRNGWGCE